MNPVLADLIVSPERWLDYITSKLALPGLAPVLGGDQKNALDELVTSWLRNIGRKSACWGITYARQTSGFRAFYSITYRKNPCLDFQSEPWCWTAPAWLDAVFARGSG